MPIQIPNDLPAAGILQQENIFVMRKTRAETQHIRPLEIVLLNLMPTKIVTETQLSRLLGNTPLQVHLELMMVSSHRSKNTPQEHLLNFYKTFDELKDRKFDGMVITGAPVEQMPFEEVDYWPELCQIMEWSKTNVHSTFHICWGAHASHPDRHRLEVDSLSVYYGSLLALNGISFSITCGHTLALMGPNGAGKSTLIKALAGLIRPDSGKILWNGCPLHDTPGEIAYLPQRSDVDWSFPITVHALVEMGRYPSLGLWKKFGRHDRDIVEKSLHVLGMESLADRQISELSGGQQQRAFLARALAQEAHVLLLDEPFTGLDAPASQSLGKLLDSLAAEGRLVIASHHDLNTAADIFDTILLMNRELAAFGPPKEVLTPARIRETYGMEPQPEPQAS